LLHLLVVGEIASVCKLLQVRWECQGKAGAVKDAKKCFQALLKPMIWK